MADLQSILSLRASDPRMFDQQVAMKVCGIVLTKAPSGNKKYPTKYRIQYPDGSPLHDVVGGFFGWGFHLSEQDAWSICPNYHDSPAADYAVLVHVRERWTVEPKREFVNILLRLFTSRKEPDHQPFRLLAYKIGDYATTALAALERIEARRDGRPDPL